MVQVSYWTVHGLKECFAYWVQTMGLSWRRITMAISTFGCSFHTRDTLWIFSSMHRLSLSVRGPLVQRQPLRSGFLGCIIMIYIVPAETIRYSSQVSLKMEFLISPNFRMREKGASILKSGRHHHRYQIYTICLNRPCTFFHDGSLCIDITANTSWISLFLCTFFTSVSSLFDLINVFFFPNV